jgi:hypothetical protein
MWNTTWQGSRKKQGVWARSMRPNFLLFCREFETVAKSCVECDDANSVDVEGIHVPAQALRAMACCQTNVLKRILLECLVGSQSVVGLLYWITKVTGDFQPQQ